jgi:hypothetical protein
VVTADFALFVFAKAGRDQGGERIAASGGASAPDKIQHGKRAAHAHKASEFTLAKAMPLRS